MELILNAAFPGLFVRTSRTSRIWSRRRLEQSNSPQCVAVPRRVYIPKSSGSGWAMGGLFQRTDIWLLLEGLVNTLCLSINYSVVYHTKFLLSTFPWICRFEVVSFSFIARGCFSREMKRLSLKLISLAVLNVVFCCASSPLLVISWISSMIRLPASRSS